MDSIKPARAMMLLDQPYPNARYMGGANSGNRNAVKLLANCCADIALLVCSPYTSIIYADTGQN